MTRRGSLVYYLTAWILGCFFMSLAVWIKDLWGPTRMPSGLRETFGILFFYFYGLVVGALAALLCAFLLRQVAALLKCKTPGHWAMYGAILTPILIGALGTWGRLMRAGQREGIRLLWALLTGGPIVVLQAGWWLAIPAGAATGYFLGRVQRAFDPARQAEIPATQTSA